jgi:hypothetical protein
MKTGFKLRELAKVCASVMVPDLFLQTGFLQMMRGLVWTTVVQPYNPRHLGSRDRRIKL